MKMQIERILTSALALGLCIGMTACGEDKTADETTAETTAVTTTAPETTAETTVETTDETTAPDTENESTSQSNETTVITTDSEDSCIHSVYYTFNEKDKTIDGVYTNWKVEGLIFDVKTFSHDGIKVFYEGNEITEGYFKEGMRVQIFHGEVLYAEYTVVSLLEPE